MFSFKFKFEIGDIVDVVSVNNIRGEIRQRKLEMIDLGTRESYVETYLVKYGDYAMSWFKHDQLKKVNDLALKNEYAVLSVIIDTNIGEGKFDLAAQFKQERDALSETDNK